MEYDAMNEPFRGSRAPQCSERISSPSSGPPSLSSLHRHFLYSTAATATPPARFVAKDYLVASCGLTPAQACRASKYIGHLKSPENPDAVRAFLAGISVSQAHATAAIARDSRLLTWKISRLTFYLSFLGSYDKVHAALRRNPFLLCQDIQNVVKPNMEFLLRCGLTDSDLARLFYRTRLLTMVPERVEELVVRAEKLGVPRNSVVFTSALEITCGLTLEKLSAKINVLRQALGCSEAETLVCRWPDILALSEDNLVRTVEFLKVEVGLEPSYIVRRPGLLLCSLQRQMPRHYVIKVLKAKGLVKKDTDFFSVVRLNEKRFVEKFLDCHKESVPGLAGVYAAVCAGQVPVETEL
ncbi:hypothetical protein HU200_017374 [Digitaria exilis]|uniref:Uncharacterized protein n=1 Tax=Digitaria exilis TaxID=1010633 RepID=A0A835KG26_9POAL|nr:hypothetical protein HU200_017374 [Digitaria exilis]